MRPIDLPPSLGEARPTRGARRSPQNRRLSRIVLAKLAPSAEVWASRSHVGKQMRPIDLALSLGGSGRPRGALAATKSQAITASSSEAAAVRRGPNAVLARCLPNTRPIDLPRLGGARPTHGAPPPQSREAIFARSGQLVRQRSPGTARTLGQIHTIDLAAQLQWLRLTRGAPEAQNHDAISR
jgi:hypothetical protein